MLKTKKKVKFGPWTLTLNYDDSDKVCHIEAKHKDGETIVIDNTGEYLMFLDGDIISSQTRREEREQNRERERRIQINEILGN